jgi:hypothetical protein
VNAQETTRDVRVLWFTRNSIDALQIRLAVASSGLSADLHVLEQTKKGIWQACVAMRLGDPMPAFLVVECLLGGSTHPELGSIRSRPRLRSLPLALLGDARDAQAEAQAASEGADGFLRLPDQQCGIARLGQDLARFWSEHRPSKSEDNIARGA